MRIGVGRNQFLGPAGFPRDLRDQFPGNKPFPIILEDDGVDVGQLFPDRCHYFANLRGRRPDDFLAIDSHHLLVAGDDPRLNNRGKFVVLDRIRDVDLSIGQ